MAHTNVASAKEKKKQFPFVFVLMFIFIVVLSVSNLDSYMTSTAPKIKRCETCGAEVKEWYTLEFTHVRAWNTMTKESILDAEYLIPYTLCGDCYWRVTEELKKGW